MWEKVVIMVQRAEIKKRQHRAVVMISVDLLVIVNATVEVSGLEAPSILFPVILGVPLVPVAQSGVKHDYHPRLLFLLVSILISNVCCQDSD